MSIAISADPAPTGRLERDVFPHPSTRSTMQGLYEDLARAQIQARVRSAERDRRAAQLVRARQLSRMGAALRAASGALRLTAK
jgi:hypothetical protein